MPPCRTRLGRDNVFTNPPSRPGFIGCILLVDMATATSATTAPASSALPPPPREKPRDWAARIWEGCDFFAWMRMLFRNRVEWLELTRRSYVERAASAGAYLELFRETFGPVIALRTLLVDAPDRAAALDRELAVLPFPVQLRRRLELLGPTYVKLGQIMAIREDLLPSSICLELQNLFDRLPPIPFPEIRRLVESSLGRPLEEMFREFDPEPIGSASIAQAHRAQLPDGTPVVVKVQYPWLAASLETDLRIANWLLVWSSARRGSADGDALFREFGDGLREELDFEREARVAAEIAANLAGDPAVLSGAEEGNAILVAAPDGLPAGLEERLATAGPFPAAVLTEHRLDAALWGAC